MTVVILIPGQPVPKARPRVVGGVTFTPQRTADYERIVGWTARLAMNGQEPFQGDVSVSITFRRKGQRRADLDNLSKAILDGCNGIVWQDDAQIVELSVGVEYNAANPGAVVEVREVARASGD